MSTQLSAQDDALLRAWRLGELDADACRAFEQRLFFEPELLDAARADLAITDGLRDRSDTITPVQGAPAIRWWPQLVAASLGAMAVLPFAWRDEAPATALSANVEWVSLDVRRGDAARVPMLVQPRATTRLVALEVALPEVLSGPYQLRLRAIGSGDDDRLHEVADVHAADGMLSLAFARDALPPGTYRIEIRRAGDDRLLTVEPPTFRYAPD
ncbi:MAG TPA: hypothetical protein VFY12_14250 [Arenimonas sp.]|nr:hypothetical protein [Arenimonas sp.]